MFDLNLYLTRINIAPGNPSLEELTKLQCGQMASVPFDNLEPFLGVVPSLDGNDIWSKLITKRLGGYCFELNWLFGEALVSSGFKARSLLGRVRMGSAVGGIRAHLAWIVTLDGRDWIADAGFGGPGPFGPVEVTSEEQVIAGEIFRFRDDPVTQERVLERRNSEGWMSLFSYNETPFTAADVVGANFICASSPSEPFRNNLMMSLRTPHRHVTLMNRVLKIASPGETRLEELQSEQQFKKRLNDLFGRGYVDDILHQAWRRLDEKPVRG